MIKLVNSFVVANSSLELETLSALLGESYPGFLLSVVGNEDVDFPFQLLVELDAETPPYPMDLFFTFLTSKIDEVNQQSV